MLLLWPPTLLRGLPRRRGFALARACFGPPRRSPVLLLRLSKITLCSAMAVLMFKVVVFLLVVVPLLFGMQRPRAPLVPRLRPARAVVPKEEEEERCVEKVQNMDVSREVLPADSVGDAAPKSANVAVFDSGAASD